MLISRADAEHDDSAADVFLQKKELLQVRSSEVRLQ